jgi:Tfp pilus assembly protein PilF
VKLVVVVLACLVICPTAYRERSVAQSGNLTLFGDVKVDESKADNERMLSLTVVLYNLSGNIMGRQTVPSGGRYRFTGVREGEYDLAVEVETREVARVRVNVMGPPGSDYRQNLEFELKGSASEGKPKVATISAADLYKRPAQNVAVFDKAQKAVDAKRYPEAVDLFKQIVENDSHDFQAWTELGTSYLLLGKIEEAESSYQRAIEERPQFFLALLNLGRMRVATKKFEQAIDPLSRAVTLQPESAEGNFLLGESYLQIKKGSKAVPYLNEAARLGRPNAHLRLATLYNAVGMKDKAAIEYEQFLKKKPDYPDRKKLEDYIIANKSKQ